MSQAAENPSPSEPPIRTGAHWTIYLPSLVVAVTWMVVYFWAIWQEPPLGAIRAVALAIESVVVPLLLVHAFLRARVLRAEISDGTLELAWGFPYRRHAQLDIAEISLAQVRCSFAQRRFGGGALALIARGGKRYMVADLAQPEEIAAAINNANRKRDAA
ncbi:MAG: hypothetical protein RH982_08595 [Parvibaculum sp.]